MPKIPDGWATSAPRGGQVGPFIPVKVPLSADFEASVRHRGLQRLCVQRLIEEVEAEGQPVAAVFDLTNTLRYYSPDLVTARGKEHVKFLNITGHGAIPGEGHVSAFIEHADRVLAAQPDAAIVVHCTHGHNRTGYMVCSYLIRRCNMSPEDAIAEFAAARPPGIYKAAYIDALWDSAGELAAGAVVRYPPETAEHDDETRGQSVCDAETGAFVQARYDERREAFRRARGAVFRSAGEAERNVKVSREPLPFLRLAGAVTRWSPEQQFGNVDLTFGGAYDELPGGGWRWRSVPPEVQASPIFQAINRPEYLGLSGAQLHQACLVPGATVEFEARLVGGRLHFSGFSGAGVNPDGDADSVRDGKGKGKGKGKDGKGKGKGWKGKGKGGRGGGGGGSPTSPVQYTSNGWWS